MKTADVQMGTAYETKTDGKFIPLRRSDWKQAAFDGALEVVIGGEIVWQPWPGQHASTLVETVEEREARQRAARAEAEARDIARRHEARLAQEDLRDRNAKVMDAASAAFGEDNLRLGRDWASFGGDEVPTLTIHGFNHASANALFVGLAKVLGRLPKHFEKSTAAVESALLMAAGLPVVEDDWSVSVRLEGEDELVALLTVLTEEVAR